MGRTAVFRLMLLASSLLAAPAAAAAEPLRAEPEIRAVATPNPVAGNAVRYWHDSRNTVVGISRNGQLVFLEVHGYSILTKPDIVSGYALEREEEGSGSCSVAYDAYSDSNGGFRRISSSANLPGNLTYPGRLVTRRLVVTSVMRTADGRTRLRNVWSWRPSTLSFRLTQTWENLSDLAYDVFRPKVVMDVSVANPLVPADSDTNNFSRTNFSVSAWTDQGFSATLRTDFEPLSADVFTPTGSFHRSCATEYGHLSGIASPPFAWAGDGALGIACWNLYPGRDYPLTHRFSLEVRP